MIKRGKKGISPIVSTSLLIVMVIILAIIIFLWARSFIGEVVEKTIQGETKSADKFCNEVQFIATVSDDGLLYIVNQGDVPIEDVQVIAYKAGESTITEIEGVKIDAGTTSKGHSNLDAGLDNCPYEQIIINPILKGKTKSGLKKYTCKNPDVSGYELPVSEVCG